MLIFLLRMYTVVFVVFQSWAIVTLSVKTRSTTLSPMDRTTATASLVSQSPPPWEADIWWWSSTSPERVRRIKVKWSTQRSSEPWTDSTARRPQRAPLMCGGCTTMAASRCLSLTCWSRRRGKSVPSASLCPEPRKGKLTKCRESEYTQSWDFVSLSVCLFLCFLYFLYGGFVFLSFDSSETLINLTSVGFCLRLTNGFFPPGYSGFPVHPLGCLELETFLFQGWTPPHPPINLYSKAQLSLSPPPPSPFSLSLLCAI